MGSGASSKKQHPILQCPQGFDAQKFRKICTLFDKLDADSNFGVSSNELTDIARLHVENCHARLQKRLQTAELANKRRVQEIEEDGIQKIAAVRLSTDIKKQVANQEYDMKKNKIQSQVEWYASLDEDGKESAFMKVLVPKGQDHVDFWTFFEYMKTRTGDIINIEDNESNFRVY